MFSVPETIEDAIAMKRLWIHEILRVYYDRLVDDPDRSWFFDNLNTICKDFLKENMNDIFVHLTNGNSGTVNIIYILVKLLSNTVRIYFKLIDWTKRITTVNLL